MKLDRGEATKVGSSGDRLRVTEPGRRQSALDHP
jgi:hypothetical protein